MVTDGGAADDDDDGDGGADFDPREHHTSNLDSLTMSRDLKRDVKLSHMFEKPGCDISGRRLTQTLWRRC
ncbi:Hypothetical predicted protein [Octopus vulgaris]|uniref:Uncharacterized protein n=1 Tax=Octopus vulgaris TaxID=6645 RepID=A0AA36BPP6_OCTVU|nr:Hypothetical predicted protein [Octopus vulgaris]